MSLLEDLNEGAMEIEMVKKNAMQIKHVVLCYVQHKYGQPSLRKEEEFPDEPTYEQINEVLSSVELLRDTDTEIDYYLGAVLPDYRMPRKSKVQRIYTMVEK